MKKIISYILLLAMAVSMFAGCAPKVEADPGLESAKEYLYTMYKDTNGTTTISSFTFPCRSVPRHAKASASCKK